MKNKVYCNNCKYYSCVPFMNVGDYDPMLMIDYAVEGFCKKAKKSTSDKKYPNKLNGFNKCEFYERKWWKFWK